MGALQPPPHACTRAYACQAHAWRCMALHGAAWRLPTRASMQGEPPGLPTRDNALESARREAVAAAAAALRHAAWAADMWEKHALMRAALRALPPGLRASAAAPDVSPFPPDRQVG
jgi:hypothetical protein